MYPQRVIFLTYPHFVHTSLTVRLLTFCFHRDTKNRRRPAFPPFKLPEMFELDLPANRLFGDTKPDTTRPICTY